MTSHRRYRCNLTLEQAVDQLRQGRGTQFYAEAVDAFLKVLEMCIRDRLSAYPYAAQPLF